jgi:Fe-S cluster biogenesis protein NfuA
MNMKEKVEKSLEKVRQMLASHGGDVELIEVDEKNGIVKISLRGACGGCPGAAMTLKSVVEKTLKTDVPEVKEVIAV